MSKKNSRKRNEYVNRQSYENSFISDVIETYNKIPQNEVDNQIEAIKTVIKYIKKASAEGKTPEEIENMILYNMSSLFSIIKYPNLTNFYQIRTLEYMMDLDIEPYIEDLLNEGIDIGEYEKKYKHEYSANVQNNVLIELCGMIKDFVEATNYTTDTEFRVLCDKIKNGKLTIADKECLTKYIKQYLKELQIGKSAFWEEQRKDPEECRKLLLKHRDEIFDVRTINFSMGKTVNDGEVNADVADVDMNIMQEKNHPKKKILEKIPNSVDSISKTVTSMYIDSRNTDCKQVILKEFSKKPFIGENKIDNFMIIMSEALNKFNPMYLNQLYNMLLASEYGKIGVVKERSREVIHDFFLKISFRKNLMHAREYLMERLNALMTFYKASGCLEQYCEVNNNKLNRIYLGDLQIDEDTLFSKFVNDRELSNQYFIDNVTDYERSYKDTPISYASDEAIIGMSAFYTNRMTKQVPIYSILGYILDKTDAIYKICDQPELEYEDLGYSRDDICMYMTMYKCFQKLMMRNYFSDIPTTQILDQDKVHRDLSNVLHKYKHIYETYYPNMGFNFERDIDFVMMDAQMIREMYDLKVFSVKSLLYTAITDKKKNIINWGFVPEDEQTDDKFALLGFDIKTLNTPLFVHMKRDELTEFLTELTGGTKIPVYEGANNMYSYTIKQRVTAQVLYPLSKDEKKKLFKLEGTGNLTDYYRHIKWLQQGKNAPLFRHAPGSRFYDLITRKIEKANKQVLSHAPATNSGVKKNVDSGDR